MKLELLEAILCHKHTKTFSFFFFQHLLQASVGLTARLRGSNAARTLSRMRSKQTLLWRELPLATPCITVCPRSSWYVSAWVGFLKLYQQNERRETVLVEAAKRGRKFSLCFPAAVVQQRERNPFLIHVSHLSHPWEAAVQACFSCLELGQPLVVMIRTPILQRKLGQRLNNYFRVTQQTPYLIRSKMLLIKRNIPISEMLKCKDG